MNRERFFSSDNRANSYFIQVSRFIRFGVDFIQNPLTKCVVIKGSKMDIIIDAGLGVKSLKDHLITAGLLDA